MRLRFTMVIGTPITEEQSSELLGTIHDVLIHPDTGAIEAFIVVLPRFTGREYPVLCPKDILHWGTRITVRSADVLAEMSDIVRLRQFTENNRPILGARICTQDGIVLGRCVDVQFSTQHYRLEWLFPRKWWRMGIPIPASHIIEVLPDAIIVSSVQIASQEHAKDVPLVTQMPEAA
jgi:uncharacterized protein YrrD